MVRIHHVMTGAILDHLPCSTTNYAFSNNTDAPLRNNRITGKRGASFINVMILCGCKGGEVCNAL